MTFDSKRAQTKHDSFPRIKKGEVRQPTSVSEALAHLDENCFEPHPDTGVLCNRVPFHHGDHVRRQSNGTTTKEVARWPRTSGSLSCAEATSAEEVDGGPTDEY